MSPQALAQAAPQGQQPPAMLELLDGFQAVQRERAAAYRRFDAAFRAYLQTKAEGPYRWVDEAGGGNRMSAQAAGLPWQSDLPQTWGPCKGCCLLGALGFRDQDCEKQAGPRDGPASAVTDHLPFACSARNAPPPNIYPTPPGRPPAATPWRS